jgi:hypothetical protein
MTIRQQQLRVTLMLTGTLAVLSALGGESQVNATLSDRDRAEIQALSVHVPACVA